MNEQISKVRKAAETCSCGRHEPVAIDPIVISRDALQQAAIYMAKRQYQRVVLCVDDHTYEAAGRKLEQVLQEEGIDAAVCVISPNAAGDVVADEASIVQLMLAIQPSVTQAVIAAGAGTIHDIVRFAAYRLQLPFLSVPTAPSVDGFTSKGAPIVIRGQKITVPACAPEALFADIDVLTAAPGELAAAGFGDMLGKYTSLFDWEFGHAAGGEPYCQAAASLTREALEACAAHAEEIGRRTEQGIRILMESLIQSGLAMLLFGQSHPASGAEHHLSHYWEMDFLRRGKRQVLHGAKVAAASAVLAQVYRELAEDGRLFPGSARAQLAAAARGLPQPERMRAWLRAARAPEMPEELGIDSGLLARSLREAHLVRPNRFTLLRARNEQQGQGSAAP
ncbi:sn-glycerol-1-phosphate dehydrogenase [Paenibacillus gansuensis]|uniref:Sn-glycerol-1-phosphate dehydrogenase n=1 Tax=Paenibacillus gansuensis TaxID=306542 RepID=A0ABW5PB70_9BACL